MEPRSIALSIVLILVGVGYLSDGCGGEIVVGDPEVKVAEFQLLADDAGALQEVQCTDQGEASACARYPNPATCASLRVTVRGDGTTVGLCQTTGVADRVLKGVAGTASPSGAATTGSRGACSASIST
jgi:hypothetical protein